ncbi:AI-2E family transporter [Actinomyces minihominis]|uniref:AI-2E family transporter n=1 Tax=Actinomyces minihominis TaxID=2002838 RepID=UPI000C07D773|nr:AI-2E family transporter [Actinomyces minihominis]
MTGQTKPRKAIYSSPKSQRYLGRNQAPANPATKESRVDVPRWLLSAGVGAWSAIGITLVIAGIVFGTSKIAAVFIAVFVALVLTGLLNPIVNRMSKHMPRGLAVALSLFGTLLIFGGLLTFVVTSVAGQWQKLAKQLSHGLDMIIDFIDRSPFSVNLTSDQVYTWLNSMIEKGQHYLAANWQRLATTALSNAGGVALAITAFALAIFITIFFLLQGSQMWRWFLNLLPTDRRGQWNHAAQAGWTTFAGYGRGTIIIAFIDGILAWVFLEVLGVPLAPALAVLVMIGALIPMVGAPAAMVLAMIVALATEGVMKAAVVGIGIALIGQFEGHILQPLIMGKQVRLHPVVVAIGVMAGTLVGGLLGAIIAIPIIAVIWSVFSSLYHRDPPIVGNLPDMPPPQVGPPPGKKKAKGDGVYVFFKELRAKPGTRKKFIPTPGAKAAARPDETA